MLPYRLVYHERYDLHLGEHVFPAKKYRWLKDRMLRGRFAVPEDFVEPEPATDEDVRLVHEAEYVAKLRSGTLSYQDILRLPPSHFIEVRDGRLTIACYWSPDPTRELHLASDRADTVEPDDHFAGRHFDAYLSSNRTCEIGMTRATGHAYESIVNALDRATRPS